jgi:AbrB family looped-hinge helix DNA binding protein
MAKVDGKLVFMNTTVEIDKAGRIVVPKKMRDMMHLRAGDKLDVRVDGDKITMAHHRTGKGLYEKGGWLVYDSGVPMSVDQSLRLVDEAREERDNFLLGPTAKR